MDFFKLKREQIRTQLTSFFAEKKHELSAVNELGENLSSQLHEFTNEGKMIRGGLVSLGYQLFKGKPESSEIRNSLTIAGAAMELFQSALLIHDDIMDRDKKRRGGESIFYRYVKKAEQRLDRDAYHTGEAFGICAGDVAFFLGFELLSRVNVDFDVYGKIVNRCAKELSYVGIAQMQDVFFGTLQSGISDKEIIDLYKYKTGRYTFSLPLAVGGTIAEQQPDTLKKIEELGELIGIIFQIKDDELGLFGEESEIGKPVGSDIMEGKKTLFSVFLKEAVEEHGEKGEREKVDAIFGQPDISDEEIAYIRQLVEAMRIRKRVDSIIENLSTRIDGIIGSLGDLHADAYRHIRSLLEYMLTRTK